MNIESIREVTVKAFLEHGRSAEGAPPILDGTTINAGQFSIDSLGLIRAFISLEDELGVEFGDETLMQSQFSTFGDVFAYVAGELDRQGAR